MNVFESASVVAEWTCAFVQIGDSCSLFRKKDRLRRSTERVTKAGQRKENMLKSARYGCSGHFNTEALLPKWAKTYI